MGLESRVLGDRFEIVAHIGAGGMGEVYRARDRARGQDVALKVLPALDATALMRFKNEFRALHDIQHPNLVTLHELHEDRGTWFFTMQHVDGVDLLTWVGGYRRAEQRTVPNRGSSPALPRVEDDDAPPCDEARLRAVLPQIAQALHRLHAAGLVHRDVKPSNVLVTPSGRALLLDFGLVTRTASAGEGIGTPDFMAPEQLEGPIGPAADWYALGVMVFRALTGVMPFAGAPEEVVRAKTHQVAPRVADLRPAAPADLAALVDALLARDPARRPTGDAVLAALGVGVAPQPVPGPRMVGRQRELGLLHDALAARLRGEPFAVCVAGESGIGKTALLRAFADDVERTGTAWVLGGRCWERESVPYKGVDGVIDELASRLAADDAAFEMDAYGTGSVLVRAFPVLRRARAFAELLPTTAEARRETAVRVSAAVRWLLAAVAARRPLVVMIDDLQWAELDTLTLLRGVLHPAPARVLFVFGVREVGRLDLRTALRTIELAPLSPDDTARIVRELVGTTAIDPAVIAREAQGHPLFAAELARHAIATGEHGPVTFDRAVQRLAERLRPEARRLLAVVSLAYTPIPVEPTAHATGDRGPALFDAIASLRANQLLASSGTGEATRLEPYHDRIRHAVVAELSADARSELHHRIALALEDWPNADAEALALHWADAGKPAIAARHALRAAEQADAALAFHRAARLYRWAAELAPVAVDRKQKRIKYAESLAQAGLGVDAAKAFLVCAHEAVDDRVLAIDLRRRAMQQLLLMGHSERALELLDELLAELELPNPTTPRRILLALLSRRAAIRLRKLELPARPPDEVSPLDRARIDLTWDACVGLALVDPLRAFYFQSVNLDLASRLGDASRVSRALLGEIPYLASSGRMTRRLERILEVAQQAAARSSFPALSSVTRGTTAFFLGHWREAAELLSECEQQLMQARPKLVDDAFGAAHLLGMTRTLLIGALYYHGRLADLIRRRPELLRDAIERNDVTAATYCRTGVTWAVDLARGDIDAAIRHADDGIQPWQQGRGQLPQFLDLIARTSIALFRARGAEAYQHVLAVWPAFVESRLLRAQYIRVTMLDLRGRATLAAARTATSPRKLIVEAREHAVALEREGAVWAAALGHAIRAGAALLEADRDGAHRSLALAHRDFTDAGMVMHAAAAGLALARLDGDAEREQAARDALRACGIADSGDVIEKFTHVLLPG
ncbi:MAG TPA: protein kinase [Kofleriaceae bacterium]|nr:protein kinase [Kofleriaceae bacterium]